MTCYYSDLELYSIICHLITWPRVFSEATNWSEAESEDEIRFS